MSSLRSVRWSFLTEVCGLGTALITFVILGTALGPGRFGLLAAVLATVGLLGPVLTASPEHVIVQRIANGADPGAAWVQSIGVLVCAGPPAALVIVAVSWIVAPAMSPLAVFLIAVGEITLLGLSRVAIRIHEATDNNRLGTRVAVVIAVSRAVSLGVFSLSTPSLDRWAPLHALAALAAAAFANASVRRHRFDLRSTSRPTLDDYRAGLPFALNAGPDGLLSNNDKMVLSGAGLTVDAGIYAAAYRIASIANVPAISVLRSQYVTYFKPENQQRRASIDNALRVARSTAAAGLVSGVALFVAAPWALIVLGDDFSSSVNALRVLAFLPLVRAISVPGANVLTGTGRQRLRIMGTAGAGILNLCLNLAFIPTYGWRAAAVTTLIAEVVLAAWMWGQVFRPTSASSSSGSA